MLWSHVGQKNILHVGLAQPKRRFLQHQAEATEPSRRGASALLDGLEANLELLCQVPRGFLPFTVLPRTWSRTGVPKPISSNKALGSM